MVFSRELPHSFNDALNAARTIISANLELVRKGLIDTEAEQLVIGAHRLTTHEAFSRIDLFARLKDRLPEETASKLLVLAGQRAEGVPLQHILGWQVFLDHEYAIDRSTLIPRPETEGLVREAIQALSSPGQASPELGYEIGLGSGVISIELLNAFPSLKMIASEISQEASELALGNARKILKDGSSRLTILRPSDAGDVLGSFPREQADFLISNPPYLDEARSSEIEAGVLRYEPRRALFADNGDPLHFYREFSTKAAGLLKPDGRLFLEIAAERASETAEIFREHWQTTTLEDLSARPRILLARRRS
jgi:release factor glutamine methyltransferase